MAETKSRDASVRISGIGQIKKRELIPFTRQTASMLNAGMSILSALSTLEGQCSHPGFKLVLKTLRENVESGSPFSDGLRHFPKVFDDLYVNMVGAGEKSGQFAVVLKRLAIMMDASARLLRKVKSAMAYPIVVLSLALVIAAGIITFVVPVFKEMFAGFGSKLPAPTQLLVDISNGVRNHWLVLILCIGGAIFGFNKWINTAAGRYQFDRFLLRLPVFGPLTQKVAVARFCRLFAQMLTSGVPILDAMYVVAPQHGSHFFKNVDQSKGQQHLIKVIALVKMSK